MEYLAMIIGLLLVLLLAAGVVYFLASVAKSAPPFRSRREKENHPKE